MRRVRLREPRKRCATPQRPGSLLPFLLGSEHGRLVVLHGNSPQILLTYSVHQGLVLPSFIWTLVLALALTRLAQVTLAFLYRNIWKEYDLGAHPLIL